MSVTYDPRRHTKEFQEYLESNECVRAQKEIIERIRSWKRDYREYWEWKEAQLKAGADEH